MCIFFIVKKPRRGQGLHKLRKFLENSHNTTDYLTLKNDIAKFFKAIPNTSAAVYNKPYRYINSFLNWMVKHKYLPDNPIKDLELVKRKEELTVLSANIEDVTKLLEACNRMGATGCDLQKGRIRLIGRSYDST